LWAFWLPPLAVIAVVCLLLRKQLDANGGWDDVILAGIVGLALSVLIVIVFDRSRRARRRQFLTLASAVMANNLSARLEVAPDVPEDESTTAWNMAMGHIEEQVRSLEINQSQLATLLNSMQEGVIALDRSGRTVWANRMVEQMAERRVVLGTALVQTIRDPELLASVHSALQDGMVERRRAVSIQPGRVIEVTAGPMPGGAVAVLHDITELERMETTRRDFIANVSHELRTPLTSITGYVETLLLDDESFDDEKRDFLSIILKNARRMNRLTEDLLALARVESGEHKLQIESVPAALILNDAMDSLAGLVADHGMTLEVAFSTERRVLADRDAMQQVFSNLVENAAKYASEGERILLGAVKKGNTVEFFVRDFGPGLRSEHLQRIFERFYRVDKARSIESGGTGLGLAIAKHIMLAHNGSIRAESVLNRGCTFLMTVPVDEAHPMAEDDDSTGRTSTETTEGKQDEEPERSATKVSG
jgi:two-component system phosphate regulon sensor histidine kinase PhoR